MIKLLKQLRNRIAQLEQDNHRLNARVRNLESTTAHHANLIEMANAHNTRMMELIHDRIDIVNNRIDIVRKSVDRIDNFKFSES